MILPAFAGGTVGERSPCSASLGVLRMNRAEGTSNDFRAGFLWID